MIREGVKKRLFIFSIFFLLIAGTSCNLSAEETSVWWPQALSEANKEGYGLTTPEEVKRLYASGKDFMILDVRPDYEYKNGHLPRAKNFEVDLGDRLQMKPDKRGAFRKVLGQEKNRLIVIYCRSFR
jgi:hypothetical protein